MWNSISMNLKSLLGWSPIGGDGLDHGAGRRKVGRSLRGWLFLSIAFCFSFRFSFLSFTIIFGHWLCTVLLFISWMTVFFYCWMSWNECHCLPIKGKHLFTKKDDHTGNNKNNDFKKQNYVYFSDFSPNFAPSLWKQCFYLFRPQTYSSETIWDSLTELQLIDMQPAMRRYSKRKRR